MHFARFENTLGFVLSGRVVMFPHEADSEAGARSQTLMKNLWFGAERRELDPSNLPAASDADREQEDGLIDHLLPAPNSTSHVGLADSFVMAFILNPPAYLPPAPARPASI